MDLTILTSHPIFMKMTQEKQKLLLDCVKQSEGVSLEKALPILISMNKQMKASGQQFTKEESDILISVLTEKMAPAERAKLEQIRKLMPSKP